MSRAFEPDVITGPARHLPHALVPILSARGIAHGYQGSLVLHGVDCDVPAGRALALMGPSGSGKTTLLHILAGIAVPQQGRVELGGSVAVDQLGHEARARLRRTTFGLVFQSGQLLGELTAIENVALPLLLEGVSVRDAEGRAAEVFEPLGVSGLQLRRPGEMSGGQQQRVAIARAIVTRPTVLLADEPTGALDRRTGDEVMDVLRGLQESIGAALVLVTHDAEIARRCDFVLQLRDGRVTERSVRTQQLGPNR